MSQGRQGAKRNSAEIIQKVMEIVVESERWPQIAALLGVPESEHRIVPGQKLFGNRYIAEADEKKALARFACPLVLQRLDRALKDASHSLHLYLDGGTTMAHFLDLFVNELQSNPRGQRLRRDERTGRTADPGLARRISLLTNSTYALDSLRGRFPRLDGIGGTASHRGPTLLPFEEHDPANDQEALIEIPWYDFVAGGVSRCELYLVGADAFSLIHGPIGASRPEALYKRAVYGGRARRLNKYGHPGQDAPLGEDWPPADFFVLCDYKKIVFDEPFQAAANAEEDSRFVFPRSLPDTVEYYRARNPGVQKSEDKILDEILRFTLSENNCSQRAPVQGVDDVLRRVRGMGGNVPSLDHTGLDRSWIDWLCCGHGALIEIVIALPAKSSAPQSDESFLWSDWMEQLRKEIDIVNLIARKRSGPVIGYAMDATSADEGIVRIRVVPAG